MKNADAKDLRKLLVEHTGHLVEILKERDSDGSAMRELAEMIAVADGLYGDAFVELLRLRRVEEDRRRSGKCLTCGRRAVRGTETCGSHKREKEELLRRLSAPSAAK
jgi:hypothetical protein